MFLNLQPEGSVNEEASVDRGIFKRRKKKVSSKVNLSVPKKPLTAYAIFIKQVSGLMAFNGHKSFLTSNV